MRRLNHILLLLATTLLGCGVADGMDEDKPAGPEPVAKTNDMRLYMHYMPWYHSKEVSGYWGSHWRMGNRNPERIGDDGQREIASHYYPLIGPYDSKDEAVIEYHLLLMKYAGIDGVLIDWYGTHNVHDYRPNLINSNALINRVDDVGLGFGIVYEEYSAANAPGVSAIEAAQADIRYMEQQYFGSDAYIHVDDEPLLMAFGPRHFQQPSQWSEIFEVLERDVRFLPLWGHDHRVGSSNADGEFSWIDFNDSLRELDAFYKLKPNFEVLIGSAYPRFHDYYAQGDWGESYGYVPSNDGQTLQKTLDLAQQHDLDYLQLATWNDFGEGTVFEPTTEDGFRFLEMVQQFAGVPYGRSELELIHTYYLKKKEYEGNTEKEGALRLVFDSLVALDVETAESLLTQLDG